VDQLKKQLNQYLRNVNVSFATDFFPIEKETNVIVIVDEWDKWAEEYACWF